MLINSSIVYRFYFYITANYIRCNCVIGRIPSHINLISPSNTFGRVNNNMSLTKEAHIRNVFRLSSLIASSNNNGWIRYT